MQRLSVLSILLFSPIVIYAQESVTTFTKADGIVSYDVRAYAPDPDGGLWIGTDDGGASYYDGITWTTYVPENSDIPAPGIKAIAIDKNGYVWMAGWGKLWNFDGNQWTIYEDTPLNIVTLAVDHDNVLWVGTGQGVGFNLHSFDGTTWREYQVRPFSLVADHPEVLAVDVDGSLWIAYDWEGGVSHLREDKWMNYTKSDGLISDAIKTIGITQNGIKWFGSGEGVSRFDGVEWESFGTDQGMKDNRVFSIHADRNNIIWFGTRTGTCSFDGDIFTNDYSQLGNLINTEIVRTFSVDVHNNKWFATNDGIIRYNDGTYPFLWVTTPNKGETLQQESVHSITWQASLVDTVRIEYSTDNGSTWNILAEKAETASGTYSWTVPAVQSEHCYIRITDTAQPLITDTSNIPFTISSSFVRLTSPNGGEIWEVATSHHITWEFIGVTAVSLEFSHDGGKTWETIADSIDASQGSYDWMVSNRPSIHCLVRIVDKADQSISDISNDVFTIPENHIAVVSPNGGELWHGAVFMDITWTASSGIADIRIEYSRNDGENWEYIAEHVNASDGFYSWRLPHLESDACLVRITAENFLDVSDISDDVFSIRPPETWNESWMESYTDINRINCMTISGDFVWCGTPSGAVRVNRYDGTRTILRSNQGFIDNDIRDIAFQNNGSMWFGTAKGISSFNGTSWISFTTENGLHDNEVSSITVDGNDDVWIGVTGYYCEKMNCWQSSALQYFDGELKTRLSGTAYYNDIKYTGLVYDTIHNSIWVSNSRETVRYNLPQFIRMGSIQSGAVDLEVDDTGNIWAVLNDGSVIFFDGESSTAYSPGNGNLPGKALALDVDGSGTAWIGTEAGLAKFDGSTWTTWTTADGLVHDRVNDVTIDVDGSVWAGTEAGLSYFDLKKFTTIASPVSLATNWASTVAVGPNNTIWAASFFGNGISRFDGTSTEYYYYGEQGVGLPHWEVYAIVPMENGVTYFATPGGVTRFNGSSWTTYSEGTGDLQDNLIKDMKLDRNGVLWAMSYGGDLASFDGETWQQHGSCSSHIDQIAIDHEGNIWADANGNYMFRYNGHDWTHFTDSIPQFSHSVTVDHENIVWTGSDDGERNHFIMYYENGLWNQLNPVPEHVSAHQTIAITEDASGVLWFGLKGGGVASYDKAGEWNIYTRANSGLIDNNVLTVVVDRKNVKWIGTERGVTSLYVPSVTVVDQRADNNPVQFRIIGNFPNPFNLSTTIEFILPSQASVTLKIYNVAGQLVRELVSETLPPDTHQFLWNGRDDRGVAVSSGVYLTLLTDGKSFTVSKMLMLK